MFTFQKPGKRNYCFSLPFLEQMCRTCDVFIRMPATSVSGCILCKVWTDSVIVVANWGGFSASSEKLQRDYIKNEINVDVPSVFINDHRASEFQSSKEKDKQKTDR